ncbi:MAG: hypothetical protein MSF32_09945 [Dysosmobacter sp.]|nr:hypothetical protein [Dysosmobacter sp.]
METADRIAPAPQRASVTALHRAAGGFQPLHLFAEGLLGDEQPLGSGADAAFLGQHQEVFHAGIRGPSAPFSGKKHAFLHTRRLLLLITRYLLIISEKYLLFLSDGLLYTNDTEGILRP